MAQTSRYETATVETDPGFAPLHSYGVNIVVDTCTYLALVVRERDGAIFNNSVKYAPSVALLFKPSASWMVYGSYIEGLKPGPTVPQEGPTPGTVYANAGTVFPPNKNKQYEAGVKFDGGDVGATLGIFQMTEINDLTVATADPNVFSFTIDGERRHRGVELNVFGEPMQGLRVQGSLTMLDAKLTRTQDGLRDGEKVIGVPRRKLVLNADYDIPGVSGLALNGTMTMVSSANRDIGIPTAGDRLPGYEIFDLGARYRTSLAGRGFTLRATARNLFDRKYFASAFPNDGYLTFGQPRIIYLSAEIEF